MEKDQILQFFSAMDEELIRHATEGETLDLIVLGRSTLILQFDQTLATSDVDVVYVHQSRLQEIAIKFFGGRTVNAERLGLYLETVPSALPPLPGGFQNRAIDIPGPWRVLRPKRIEHHDLVVTKLKRFRPKDRADLKLICDSVPLDQRLLEERVRSAFEWEDKDDADRDRAVLNLKRVFDYLDGLSSTL